VRQTSRVGCRCGWLLWPQASAAEHHQEIEAMLLNSSEITAFIALDAETAAGFSEVSLRRDYVNGCQSSPVAFLEGLYVRPDYRRPLLNQPLATNIIQ
jgi:aminoglycoside 6'-N-acetyltransferase I